MKTPDYSTRAALTELMDDRSIDEGELRATLGELDDINRKLGGYGPSRSGVAKLLPRDCSHFSLLDVGTGGGDFARDLRHWATRKGKHVRIHAIDISPTILDIARQRDRADARSSTQESIQYEVADLLGLPDDQRFDIVHAALLLHHFNGPSARTALAKMLALSRWGVVINDLHRHPLAYHSIQWLTRWRWRNRLIRHDAPVSVLRAFRRKELADMAGSLGSGRIDIRWCWAFRWQLVIHKHMNVSSVETREGKA